MAKLGQNRMWQAVATPQDGSGAQDAAPSARYCALCGQEASPSAAAIERFGEPFCSEAHAGEFTKAVRAARVQAVATEPSTTEMERLEGSAEVAAKQQSWKGLLKMGLCCGAPLLAVVVLAGGGGAVLGAAGAFLPALAMLACPLGMYFMMRSMSKTGQRDDRGDKGEQK